MPEYPRFPCLCSSLCNTESPFSRLFTRIPERQDAANEASNQPHHQGVAMESMLVINSSAAREGSVSRELVEFAVDRLRQATPQVRVIRRDLGDQPVPHLSVATLNGVRGTPTTAPERAARVLSDELIAELRAADTIVIGAPMYNF